MNKLNKGLASIIAIIIIVVIVLVGGGAIYYYENNHNVSSTQQVQNQQQNTQQVTQTQQQAQNQQSNQNNTTNNVTNNQINQAPGCRISLQVSGGSFSPQTCEFEIVTPGVPCPQNTVCAEYRLTMKDSNTSHIGEVNLYYFKNFNKGMYNFDPSISEKDFNGSILDVKAVNRNLSKGTISLEPLAGGRIQTSFNLSFENNISVNGLGILPVIQRAGP